MSASEPTRRRPKTQRREPVDAKPCLSHEEMQELQKFVDYALGGERLSWFEANFVNTMKDRLYRQVVWLSDKERVIIQQIKDKLHYDCEDIPPPPLDPDGIEEDDDPDGLPAVHDALVDQREDDELVKYLIEA